MSIQYWFIKVTKVNTLCHSSLNMQISMIRHVFENVLVLEDKAGLQELLHSLQNHYKVHMLNF